MCENIEDEEKNNKEKKDIELKGVEEMARQTKRGRKGAVRNRAQYYNFRSRRWVKVNTRTGKILSVKSDKEPYKGIRKL